MTTLSTLDDRLALQILTTVAGPRVRSPSPEAPPAAELLEALADTFGPPAEASPPTDAALARAADEPATRAAIEGMREQEAPPTYGLVATTAVVTAVIAILQTEVTFERTPAGKWKVKLHKKAATDALLKGLAHAVMKALSSGAGKDAPRLPK